jgi:hypothetical protein
VAKKARVVKDYTSEAFTVWEGKNAVKLTTHKYHYNKDKPALFIGEYYIDKKMAAKLASVLDNYAKTGRLE